MITFYLVRHGHSEGNALGVRPGHLPFPLTELGRKQASLTGERLREEKLDAVYASDSVRTTETAQFIMKHQNCPLIFDRRLRDIRQGEFLGLTNKEIAERFPDVLPILRKDPIHGRRPGGETFAELEERTFDSLSDMVTTWSGKKDAKIAVVTHGGVVNMLVHATIGEFVPKIAGNCSITIVKHEENTDSNWSLSSLDNMDHLKDLPPQKAGYLIPPVKE
jgi:broad specificity phosphatase PhoE